MFFYKFEKRTIPNKFCITSFSYNMNMYWFMLQAEKHKYEAVSSKNFWHNNLSFVFCKDRFFFKTHKIVVKK